MRLIDADALRDRLQNLAYDDWNQGACTTWANAYSECADIVEDAQTIESESIAQIRWERDTAIQQLADLGYGLGEKPERKTGRWIADEGIAAWKCSCCGGLPLLDDYSQMQLTKYCPYCGAKMEVDA